MRIHHLGASLAVLFLVSSVLAEKVIIPPPRGSAPNLAAVFFSYSSDGVYLTQDELRELLPKEFSQIQSVNDELMEEFMLPADADEDGKLNKQEFINLANFITRDKHQ